MCKFNFNLLCATGFTGKIVGSSALRLADIRTAAETLGRPCRSRLTTAPGRPLGTPEKDNLLHLESSLLSTYPDFAHDCGDFTQCGNTCCVPSNGAAQAMAGE